MKACLELKPCWTIQKECSRQTRMAVHVTVRNYTYKRKRRFVRPMKQCIEGAYIIENA